MKFCVIGLGRFGYEVATVLAENGMEVVAIDSSESIVASIKDRVTQAICIRISDENSLRSIGVEAMDVAIVAMAENFAQSILITAILKKHLQIRHVVARAIDEMHREILTLVGADQIVLPEKEIGIRLADNLSSPLTDQIRLSHNFIISHIKSPLQFVGKQLKNIEFFEIFHVTCVGVKKDENILLADPGYTINKGDKLLLAGSSENLDSIARLV